ncbi:MAG: hypothetical protein KF802_03710 [Bdellovibrionaceae bacterium]|nr:hypothetical protein [Pseudobdellovibrionaceae bacterium]
MELKHGRKSWPVIVAVGLALGAVMSASAQNFQAIANWRYLPLQEEFFRQTEELGAKGEDLEVVELALRQRDKRKGTSEEGEARVVLAQACVRMKMPYCAFHFALKTAQDFPGSMPSLKALEILEGRIKAFPFVEKDVQRLINSGSFKDVPDVLVPMVSYYVALDNSDKKLTPWIDASVKKIGEANYWRWRWSYLSALEDARRKTAMDGLKRLEALEIETGSEPRLQAQIRLQIARLKFELTDYDAALKIYESLPLQDRTSGQILRERAWVHFARKDYAETLGLLQSLKAPTFQQAMDPDVFFLEMLALRSLCHFESVKKPAADFRKIYNASIEHIRARKPLSDNVGLSRMSFMRTSLDPYVQTVSQIREERRLLESSALAKPFQNELKGIYDRAEKSLREDAEILLRDSQSQEAQRLLEMADQVQLVEYLSGLDAYRIRQGYEKDDYTAATAERGDYKTLFWPVRDDEYWLDELRNYRVLANDRCSGKSSR